ncbi:MAG: 2-oxoglutarate dehydrogenase complex dihydrolipoyllysine-residue succinyltransferase [Gammaproteobacteria bacterium]|nr:2-oxoglutarate dehydrogenase complex dihydrolipoyllysine-residue succinyltransferase [Gammaproteobacteria bacterium]
MAIEIRVPVLPESVADATILSWHKAPGDAIARDENLVDIETDKVVLEVPAPQDGILQSIIRPAGETVLAEELIALIDALDGTDTASDTNTATTTSDESKDNETRPESQPTSDALALSPAVRKLVAENDLDPTLIHGSGRDERILKEDVLNYIKNRSAAPATAAPAASSASLVAKPQTDQPAIAPSHGDARQDKRVPMSRLRKRIAERLVEVQQSTAMLTTFNEVNMQAVMDLRKQYRDPFEKEHGIKLGFMSFFVKACVEALKRYPIINASMDGDDILYHNYYDIGIAVSSPRGLVVPVLRDVDQLSLAGIEKNIADFATRARESALAMDDLTGGTFTITNGGVFGSLMSTPILNPPQSAILGMHTIQQRAVVEGGEICARPMMYLAVSYDHRIIDGRDAVQFLVAIKNSLEDPARMLLEI